MYETQPTSVYANNLKSGLFDPERAQDTVDDIAWINPTVFFLSEAAHADRADGPNVVLSLDRLRALGYTVTSLVYSEDGRQDRHLGVWGAKAERQPDMRVVEFAGRKAIEMMMRTSDASVQESIDDEAPETDTVTILMMHNNDLAEARAAEVDAVMARYSSLIESGRPFIYAGDLNSSANVSGFTKLLNQVRPLVKGVLGLAAKFGVYEAKPGDPQPQPIGRIMSVLHRGVEQATGREVHVLESHHLVDTNEARLPTALVPHIPARRLLDKVGPVRNWLARAHLQNDHIMVANGTFQHFRRHDLRPGDDHHGISVEYYPRLIQTATLPPPGH